MNEQILEIRVSPKGIKPVRNGHPWVFRNAMNSHPRPAELAAGIHRTVFGTGLDWTSTQPALVCDPTGSPLGWGIFNPKSRLALRMITRNSDAPIQKSVILKLLVDALARREQMRARQTDTNAFRLVFGEADGLPGLVVDLLGETLVLEISGAFCWENRHWIRDELLQRTAVSRFHIIPDREMLDREGLPGPHAAESSHELVPIVVRENGLSWQVDLAGGQKTGFYCDQRDNRRWVRENSRGLCVLDAFCYHGGFGLTAIHGGAEYVQFVDSSAAALQMLETNRAVQAVEPTQIQAIKGDFFSLVRNGLDISQFDLVILDPPKLVPARHHREAGLRAYKDLNLAVMSALRPGARLVTFSCSGAVSRDDFRTALSWAAADARRSMRIEGVLTQGADHPVPLHFPEAEYLKGYVLRAE